MEWKTEYFKYDTEKEEINKMTTPRKDECAECRSNNVHYNEKTQQIICKDCGAIFEELTPEEEKKFEKAHDQK